MKILIINKFLKPKGGSETYIIQLGNCLQQKGHEVQYFGMDEPGRTLGNHIDQYTSNLDFHTRGLKRLTYPFRILYSREARRKIIQVLEDFQPDVVHLNNFNYQLTPSVIYGIRAYDAGRGKKTTVIYTAHDYQLICPNHMLNSPKDGKNCELCVDGHYFACIKKRCIHLSPAKSILGAAEGILYRKLNIYRYIDRIICPSYFMESKMNQVTVFRDKTVTLHNFAGHIEDMEPIPVTKGDYVLYFGRYSREKGIDTLLKACRELSDIPFVFAGAGPLEDGISHIPNIINQGFVKGPNLHQLIKEARFSIYPSEYYENCPFSVIESQLLRTPVLGARIGGIPELIQEGVNGALFTSGDLGDLKEKIRYLWDRPQLCAQWSDHCRDIPYDTVETYCNKLLELYGAGREG